MRRRIVCSFFKSLRQFSSQPSPTKVLEVGLVAVPNAGKSQLTNRLVGQKVTAVSAKRNTTRLCTLGAYVEGSTQVILHDLPGVLRPKDAQHRGQLGRIQSAWTAAEECDVATFIVDASLMIQALDEGSFEATPEYDIAHKLNSVTSMKTASKPNLLLVLNKIDLIPRELLMKLISIEDRLKQRCDFVRSFYVSALKGRGIQELRTYFRENAKEGEWVLPDGAVTDKTIGELAVELVREKLFRRLNRELPYAFEIALTRDDVGEEGEVLLQVEVVVPTQSVRKIVIGRRGCVIDDYVTSSVRFELEKMLRKRVWLNVNVKAKS